MYVSRMLRRLLAWYGLISASLKLRREEQHFCQGGFSLTPGLSTQAQLSTVTTSAWPTPSTGPSPARACTPWTTPGPTPSRTSTAWQSCRRTIDLSKLARFIHRLTKNKLKPTNKRKEVARNKIIKAHNMPIPIINLLKIIAKLTSRHVAACLPWSLIENLVKTNHSACKCSECPASQAPVKVSVPPSSTTQGTCSSSPSVRSSKINHSNLMCFKFNCVKTRHGKVSMFPPKNFANKYLRIFTK